MRTYTSILLTLLLFPLSISAQPVDKRSALNCIYEKLTKYGQSYIYYSDSNNAFTQNEIVVYRDSLRVEFSSIKINASDRLGEYTKMWNFRVKDITKVYEAYIKFDNDRIRYICVEYFDKTHKKKERAFIFLDWTVENNLYYWLLEKFEILIKKDEKG